MASSQHQQTRIDPQRRGTQNAQQQGPFVFPSMATTASGGVGRTDGDGRTATTVMTHPQHPDYSAVPDYWNLTMASYHPFQDPEVPILNPYTEFGESPGMVPSPTIYPLASEAASAADGSFNGASGTGPRPYSGAPDSFDLLTYEEVLLRHSSSDNFHEGEEADLHFAPSRPCSQPEKISKQDLTEKPSSTIGENRLKINFIQFGTPGDVNNLQRFGPNLEGIVPHGLCGTTEVYTEQWMFWIHHRRPKGYTRTVVEWRIRNLTSTHEVVRMETEQEAHVRETQARTICNQVLREALEHRRAQLELELTGTSMDSKIRVANLQGRVRALRPKRLLIGLLFFGLQHRTLQSRMAELLEETSREKES